MLLMFHVIIGRCYYLLPYSKCVCVCIYLYTVYIVSIRCFHYSVTPCKHLIPSHCNFINHSVCFPTGKCSWAVKIQWKFSFPCLLPGPIDTYPQITHCLNVCPHRRQLNEQKTPRASTFLKTQYLRRSHTGSQSHCVFLIHHIWLQPHRHAARCFYVCGRRKQSG